MQPPVWSVIDDVERNGHCFSDGCGLMRQSLASTLTRLWLDQLPRQQRTSTTTAAAASSSSSSYSAFQIRFAGFKGVLAVTTDAIFESYCGGSKSLGILFRPSMYKFESDHQQMEVCRTSEAWVAHLNRQIILLLATLGVRDHVFLQIQAENIRLFERGQTDVDEAMRMMRFAEVTVPRFELLEMLRGGFDPHTEPYLRAMLRRAARQSLQKIVSRAHLFVPKAQLLLGVIDESNSIPAGHVFIQVSPPPLSSSASSSSSSNDVAGSNDDKRRKAPVVIQGKVVIAKNPCFHPGVSAAVYISWIALLFYVDSSPFFCSFRVCLMFLHH